MQGSTRVIHILAFAAALALLAGLFLVPADVAREWKRTTLSLVAPFYRGIGTVRNWLAGITVDFRTYEDLRDENQKLRSQNALLQAENSQFQTLREENARLKSALKFQEASRFELIVAQIVAREPSTWWNYVIIDRGSNDGLQPDQAVVNTDGLVGKVATVTPGTAKVVLLGDDNCRVSASLGEGDEVGKGIVIGEALQTGSVQCRMTFISHLAFIELGEKVYTSGLGGVFPPRVLIGTVSAKVDASEVGGFGLYQEVIINPAAKLADLDEVFVVLAQKERLGSKKK